MKLKSSFKGSFAVLAATLSRAPRALALTSVGLALFMGSCGPVNQKPAQNLSQQGKNQCDPQVPTDLSANPQASGTPASAVSYSQNHQFIVSVMLQDVDTGSNPTEEASPMTDNLYTIRFVSGRNLSVPSANALLTASYTHATSTETNNYPLDVARQGDHFVTTIHFGQSGNYALHLHLTDGAP
jgi:hypothetical protein